MEEAKDDWKVSLYGRLDEMLKYVLVYIKGQ